MTTLDIGSYVHTELFEALLKLGKLLGLSRSVATVFAVLYTAEDALSVEELVDASTLSKSAVSLALRELGQLGAVQERLVVGERCRRYTGQDDLSAAAVGIVLARVKAPLDELHDAFEALPDTSRRTQQAGSLLQLVENTLHCIQQTERISKART